MSDGWSEEYDCADCGCAVVRLGIIICDAPKLCAGCGFLREVEDPAARAEMRALFLERGLIGPVELKAIS